MDLVDSLLLAKLLPVELVEDLFVSTGSGARVTNPFAEVVVSVSSVNFDFLFTQI